MPIITNFKLPTTEEVHEHVVATRTFDTSDAFKGIHTLAPKGGFGTTIILERGVRANVLYELTGRIALNPHASKEWHWIFDKASA